VDDMKRHLRKRAAELGLERADQLEEIQAYLDELYPGQCRAASLNDGVLRITTPNASLASELRLRQVEVLQALEPLGVSQTIIKIG
jgi:hypothetical protein